MTLARPPEPSTGAPGQSHRRLATCVGVGVGVGVGLAGLVAFGVTAGLAVMQNAIVNPRCGAGIASTDETAWDAIGLAAVTSERPLAVASMVGLARSVAVPGPPLRRPLGCDRGSARRLVIWIPRNPGASAA